VDIAAVCRSGRLLETWVSGSESSSRVSPPARLLRVSADVHELGDAVVQILQAVRAMTQPSVLAAAPTSCRSECSGWSARRATTTFMAIMIEVLRRIGGGANALTAKPKQLETGKPTRGDARVAHTEAAGHRAQAADLEVRLRRVRAAPSAGDFYDLAEGAQIIFTSDVPRARGARGHG
jgi:hypothetical protein